MGGLSEGEEMVGGTVQIKCSEEQYKKILKLGEVIEVNEWWVDESRKDFRGKIRIKED